jgi:hypothetical protein
MSAQIIISGRALNPTYIPGRFGAEKNVARQTPDTTLGVQHFIAPQARHLCRKMFAP